jgi:predicted nucleic acid-binding protein
VIFLDAYCLVALARDEPAASEVESLLRDKETAITSVNLLEVVDFLVRRAGWAESDVRTQLSHLVGQVIRVTPVTEAHAWSGASLRARRYARDTSDLSLADCVLLASCREGEAVATSDPAIAAAARAEGIVVVALPDSGGRKP